MNHDRRDDRTPATRCATGIMPVAASPSNAPPTPTPSALGGGFVNVRRRSSVQVNCRTKRRRTLKNILQRTAMGVKNGGQELPPRPTPTGGCPPAWALAEHDADSPTVAGLLKPTPPEGQ